jgi:hypothetical protein
MIQKDYEGAFHVLEVMKNRKKDLQSFVDQTLIGQICNMVGKPNAFATSKKSQPKFTEIQEEEDV